MGPSRKRSWPEPSPIVAVKVGPVDPSVDHEIIDLLNAKILQSCRTFLELLTTRLERLRSKAVMHNDRQ